MDEADSKQSWLWSCRSSKRCTCSLLTSFTCVFGMLSSYLIAQDASEDLQKKLQEKSGEEDREKGAAKTKTDARASTAAAKSESRRSSGLPGEDNTASSPDPVQSDFDGSDLDDGQGNSSDDMDRDLFTGQFAIKDKDRAMQIEDGNRFSILPSKIKKLLINFEPDVLQSIPRGISE